MLERILPFIIGIIFGIILLYFVVIKKIKCKWFTPLNTQKKTNEFINNMREVVINQILNNHESLFIAIAKQRKILANNHRKPIAIFLSPDMFKELLRADTTTGTEKIDELYSILKDLRVPVGFLGELPIYISELLTDAPVQVVGDIRWSL